MKFECMMLPVLYVYIWCPHSPFLYPRPGEFTAPSCTGTCHVTNCRACYYSRTVQTCQKHCKYDCGEDPSLRCLKKWSQCVKKGLQKVGGAYSRMYIWCVYIYLAIHWYKISCIHYGSFILDSWRSRCMCSRSIKHLSFNHQLVCACDLWPIVIPLK